MMDGTTNRARDQARPGAVRRDRRLRWLHVFRAPFAAAVLTLLALTAPSLTVAPLLATDPQPPAATAPALLVPERRPPPTPSVVALDGGIVVEQGTAPRLTTDAVRYQAALDEARSRAKAFGVTFAVVRDGELVWVGGSGVTRNGEPMSPDTPMVIGSVTKTFVAAAILQLVAEDRLDLDDPARRHLPGLSSISRDITIEQLLNHTSGLADVFNDNTRIGIETDVAHAWTPDEVLEALHEPWYEPGAGWAYSNTNYLLLSLIVEEITGEPFADVVASRLTEPLGLASTAVLTGRIGEALAPAWSTIFRGSGAMVSNAADLARWGDTLYDGSVLPPALRQLMVRVNGDDYGLGAQRIVLAGRVGIGHTGLLNTDTTLLLHVPSRDVTIAMLVNRTQVDLDLLLRAHPPDGGPSLMELAATR
jgi:D-alanyl-D-alanine carboxypeptidase